jgi:hypothetical protein
MKIENKTEECFECQQQSYVQGPSTYYHNITLKNSSAPAKRWRLISNIDHLWSCHKTPTVTGKSSHHADRSRKPEREGEHLKPKKK